MANRRIKINGVHFELHQRKEMKCWTGSSFSLYDCYERPSVRKQEIYKYWEEFASSVDAEYFSISTYNANIFTLDMIFTYDGVRYYAHITPTHNDLYYA